MRIAALAILLIPILAAPGIADEKRLREIAIAREEKGLANLEEILDRITKSKVIKGGRGQVTDEDYAPATQKGKTASIKVYTTAIANQKKKIKDLKAGGKPTWPQLDFGPIKFGDVGTVGDVFVSSVVDKNRAIVRMGSNQGKEVLATFPTDGFIRGSKVYLDGVWEITGTAKGEMFEIMRLDR